MKKQNHTGRMFPVLRKVFWLMVTLLFATGVTHISVQADDGRDDDERAERDSYAIGLWGDLPYSDLQATVCVPNLIADMNAQRLAFTVHDGDLKQGSNSPCNDALYLRSLGYFNSLRTPAAFTP